MNIEEIREYCLSLPHVTEDSPFGLDSVVYRIGGKIFCLIELSGHWQFYNLKCAPDYSIELRDRYDCIRPGFHVRNRYVNTRTGYKYTKMKDRDEPDMHELYLSELYGLHLGLQKM